MINAPGPPRPPLPGTVRAAVYTQIGAAALLLVGAVAAVVYALLYNSLITRAARTVSADPAIVSEERFGSIAIAVAPGGISLVLGLLFGGLTIGLWRGVNATRILTVVAAGVPMLCGLCQAGSGALVGLLVLGIPQGPPPDEEPVAGADPFAGADPYFEDPGYDKFYTELDRISSGLAVATILVPVLALLILAALVATIILLFLPSANRYFRPYRNLQYLPVPYPVYLPHPAPLWPDRPPAPDPDRAPGPDPAPPLAPDPDRPPGSDQAS